MLINFYIDFTLAILYFIFCRLQLELYALCVVALDRVAGIYLLKGTSQKGESQRHNGDECVG